MLEVTDKMIEELNKMMDSASFTKDEVVVFETFSDLAKYIYADDIDALLTDLEEAKVMDESLSLLENLFYDQSNILEEGSFGWIYYLLV